MMPLIRLIINFRYYYIIWHKWAQASFKSRRNQISNSFFVCSIPTLTESRRSPMLLDTLEELVEDSPISSPLKLDLALMIELEI